MPATIHFEARGSPAAADTLMMQVFGVKHESCSHSAQSPAIPSCSSAQKPDFHTKLTVVSKGCSAKMQAEQVVPNPYKLLLLGVLALGGALPVTVVLLWDIQVAGLHQVQLD